MNEVTKRRREMKSADIRESTTTVKSDGVTRTVLCLIIPDSETQRSEAIRRKEGDFAANTADYNMMVKMFAEGKRRFGEKTEFVIGTDPEEEATKRRREMKSEDIRESTSTMNMNGVTRTVPHLIIPDIEIEKLRKIREEEGEIAYNDAYLDVATKMFAEGERRFGKNTAKPGLSCKFTIGTDPEEEVTNGDEKNH